MQVTGVPEAARIIPQMKMEAVIQPQPYNLQQEDPDYSYERHSPNKRVPAKDVGCQNSDTNLRWEMGPSPSV